MQIEVGKVYKNKQNEQIKIERKNDTVSYPLYEGEDNLFYDEKGICLSNVDWTEMYDLVEECFVKNPFLDENVRLEKMLSNYKKYNSLIIGVDFDFTLNCPISKHTYSDIVDLLKSLQDEKYNFIFCVWTANIDREYVEKTWKENGLNFHHYNNSPINPGHIKPHFNILLDDSAGLNESCNLLKNIKSKLDQNI